MAPYHPLYFHGLIAVLEAPTYKTFPMRILQWRIEEEEDERRRTKGTNFQFANVYHSFWGGRGTFVDTLFLEKMGNDMCVKFALF